MEKIKIGTKTIQIWLKSFFYALPWSRIFFRNQSCRLSRSCLGKLSGTPGQSALGVHIYVHFAFCQFCEQNFNSHSVVHYLSISVTPYLFYVLSSLYFWTFIFAFVCKVLLSEFQSLPFQSLPFQRLLFKSCYKVDHLIVYHSAGRWSSFGQHKSSPSLIFVTKCSC